VFAVFQRAGGGEYLLVAHALALRPGRLNGVPEGRLIEAQEGIRAPLKLDGARHDAAAEATLAPGVANALREIRVAWVDAPREAQVVLGVLVSAAHAGVSRQLAQPAERSVHLGRRTIEQVAAAAR